jgi:hypothetical protein
MIRPSALVLLGLWAGLLAASWALAGASFKTADQFSGRTEIASRLPSLDDSDRRMLLRSVAAELNRWMFRARSGSEIVLGLVLLVLVWKLPGGSRGLVGVALAVALLQALWLSPAIAELGRSLDFVRRPLPAEVSRHFGLLHGAYVLLDLGKGILLTWFGWAATRPLG